MVLSRQQRRSRRLTRKRKRLTKKEARLSDKIARRSAYDTKVSGKLTRLKGRGKEGSKKYQRLLRYQGKNMLRMGRQKNRLARTTRRLGKLPSIKY